MRSFALWLLCASPVLAAPLDVCRPPNVPRVVVELLPAWNGPLVCPLTGECYHDMGDVMTGSRTVVCLSPAEMAAAEARER